MIRRRPPEAILIIDGNALFRRTVHRMIAARFPDSRILEAADAATALTLADTHQPSVILMDISLPGSDGLRLRDDLRHRCPEALLIVITSDDWPEYREETLNSGADYFISKSAHSTRKVLSIIAGDDPCLRSQGLHAAPQLRFP